MDFEIKLEETASISEIALKFNLLFMGNKYAVEIYRTETLNEVRCSIVSVNGSPYLKDDIKNQLKKKFIDSIKDIGESVTHWHSPEY